MGEDEDASGLRNRSVAAHICLEQSGYERAKRGGSDPVPSLHNRERTMLK